MPKGMYNVLIDKKIHLKNAKKMTTCVHIKQKSKREDRERERE